MQTFVPMHSFSDTAFCLDRQRLGKQRVECKQIILALLDSNYGWQHHPAVRMWRGYVGQLATYAIAMCDDWMARGYTDTMRPFFEQYADPDGRLPKWYGDDRVHQSHRRALFNKLPDHYRQYGWSGAFDGYHWPV
jgi:hypothetical protein